MTKHLQLVPTDTAETTHNPADPIAQAIMAIPIGGQPVQILVGEHRHVMHHWTVEYTDRDRLHVVWNRRDDLPPLHEPLWWRVYTSIRREGLKQLTHAWTREN